MHRPYSNNLNKTFIKEIFTSLQGEGPYTGEKQIFVRFCKCNLNCDFCDTDFKITDADETKSYTTSRLFNILNKSPVETVCFTGGEPLLDVRFLRELFAYYDLNKKIYLETNGVCHEELKEIIDYINIISMDIKLSSATKQKNRFSDNEKFLNIANKKEVFIKVVFENNISDDEIENVAALASKNSNLIILQPKMPVSGELEIQKIFNKFYTKYQKVRLIPQMHKFLNIK